MELRALNLLFESFRLDSAFTERFLIPNFLPAMLGLETPMGYGKDYLRIFIPVGTEAICD